jgi:threonyl-tRNA synthetase
MVAGAGGSGPGPTVYRAGLRAEVSEPDRGTLGARIRLHRLVPYQVFVGAGETTSDTVSLRLRIGLSLDPMPTREAVDRIITATSSLSLEL